MSPPNPIADDFFLLAHDEYTGKPLLHSTALGLGVAAGLLTELCFHGCATVYKGQLQPDMRVMPAEPGERPAGLVDLLPCVVIARIGGVEIASHQDVVADRPLLSVDCYASGLPATRQLTQRGRRALHGLGARPVAGPAVTPDEDEPAGVRRVTFTVTVVAR